jgi:molecular chaperone DnaK
MGLGITLVILAVVVVGLAYGIGVYLRRREGAEAPETLTLAPEFFTATNERQEQAVVSWLCSQAFEQTGVRVAEDKVAFQRITEAARIAIRDLASQPDTLISLPALIADAAGPKHFEIRLTQEVLRELARY